MFSKTFEKNYISKSIGRNISSENSSAGRKQNEKTFSFVNKANKEIKSSEKYTCNLSKKKKISSNVYNKSTKSKNYNKNSNKHSIKCSGTNNKLKFKMKKNGFFDEGEPLNSHRANAADSENMADELNMYEKWINSNANTDRGHYHNFEEYSVKPKDALIIKSDSTKDNKIKKKISRKKIENLAEKQKLNKDSASKVKRNSIEHDKFIPEKPKLEIQIDSLVGKDSLENKEESKKDNDLKFKHKENSSVEQSQSPPIVSQQKGNIANDLNAKMKLSFGGKSYPPIPNTYSSPPLESSSQSNIEGTSSETKQHKVELSKQAKMLRDRLNLPDYEVKEITDKVKSDKDEKFLEEEKGALITEELDQSRPITTRIHDNEDDQQLDIPCDRQNEDDLKSEKEDKHLSVEAGLERKSKEEKTIEESENLVDDQCSMIVKQVEDLEGGFEFPFSSQIHTPTKCYQADETNEDDVLTVIEHDWDNLQLFDKLNNNNS